VRVAALYDVHANLPALEAVLREVEAAQPDRIVIGGDAATGPMNAETLDALMAPGDRALFVQGNADRWTVGVYDDPSWVSPEDEQPGRRAAALGGGAYRPVPTETSWPRSRTVELDVDDSAARCSATAHRAPTTRRSLP
jgi:predicted phosphodiesterase